MVIIASSHYLSKDEADIYEPTWKRSCEKWTSSLAAAGDDSESWSHIGFEDPKFGVHGTEELIGESPIDHVDTDPTAAFGAVPDCNGNCSGCGKGHHDWSSFCTLLVYKVGTRPLP